MNTQLFNKLKKRATKATIVPMSDGVATTIDPNKLIGHTVEEVIELLKKGDPDFNNFSERLVREHFGIR